MPNTAPRGDSLYMKSHEGRNQDYYYCKIFIIHWKRSLNDLSPDHDAVCSCVLTSCEYWICNDKLLRMESGIVLQIHILDI